MKKLLTAGIFGTILGIVGAGTTNASIVSSGFLDEKLTEYALSTSLDLKANQTDLTALSNKIGTLPSAILPSAWTAIPYYTEYGVNMPDAGFPLPTTIGEQLESLLNGGPESPIDRMFRIITLAGNGFPVGTLNPGTNDPQEEFLGLHPLTQKVRSIEENITLPSGEILPSKGLAFLLPEPPNSTYPTSIRDFMTDIYTGYWSVSGLAEAVYHGNEIMGQQDPTLIVKGLRQITDEIGTLPSGNFPIFLGSEFLFPELNQPDTYPTSLAELITAIYGNSETRVNGLLSAISAGIPFDTDGDGSPDAHIGIISNFELANAAINLVNAKIGTLPSGNFPPISGLEFISNKNISLTYPTSLAELITALYGDSETGARGLLGFIIRNLPYDSDRDGKYDSHVGLIPNYNLAKNANDLANANATKIGTLPTEYATVGAALTAIKGIAEDAKAAALAAIPDPKQEGSSGKFVLTVDIVGDNATYRWEKIDREGETTTTTTTE